MSTLIQQCKDNQIEFVRFLFCDTTGIIRGKTCSVASLERKMASGIGLVKGSMAQNILDILQPDTGLGATGEIRLIPDPGTFKILPYARGQAAMFCDMLELDKTNWSLCPRHILKRQIENAAVMGLHFKAAFEPEFYLFRKEQEQFIPIDNSMCFSTEGMNRAADFIFDFSQALNQQGISVEQYYPELGHGQHELSIRHEDALTSADNQLTYRDTLRGIATRHGLIASLAPKPNLKAPGSGCHLHISAWDPKGKNNLFADPEEKLSATGRYFIAGLLHHLPALVALTCASINSYRRLQPRSWSSAYVCWGWENREAAIRVPSTYWSEEAESTNIEIKCADSSCNPYIALAAVICAGLDGIKKQLPLPAPIQTDPAELMESGQKEEAPIRLPSSLNEALKKLIADIPLFEGLGPDFLKTYLIVKNSEVTALSKATEEEERHIFINKF